MSDIDDIMERKVPTGQDALSSKPVFERESVNIPVYGGDCLPDVFVDGEGNFLDFELTLVSLMYEEELSLQRQVTSAAELPMAVARRSISAYNGQSIGNKQRNFIWKALGPKGRQLVLLGTQAVNSIGTEAVGKVQERLGVDFLEDSED